MKTYKLYKKISLSLILVLLFQIVAPSVTYALTSGPSQPEVQSFEPVGTSQMVDLFSGDFNYNIPLLEVGGYPINIAYHAGIGMEQEASWVGLGWSLNPGAINRSMRGIPDDYAGEVIQKKVNQKKNVTVSLLVKPEVELFGLSKKKKKKPIGSLNFSAGVRYNNYKGVSIIGSANIGLDIIKMGSFGLNLNMGVDLENGISITPSLSSTFKISEEKNIIGKLNIGAPYNSRQGLSELTFSKEYSRSVFEETKKGLYSSKTGVTINSTLANFNTPSYITNADFNSEAFSFSLNLGIGGEIPFTNIEGSVLGSYSQHKINGTRNLKAYGYLNHHLANPELDLLDFNREQDGPYFPSSNVLPLTNLTNDVYAVTGQGMGGVFRGFRNQISYVTDPSTFTSNDDASFGLDVGTPAATIPFKGGGNVAVHQLTSTSGLWFKDNNALTNYNTNKLPVSSLNKMKFEPTYLKQLGELSADNGRFDNLGRLEALAFENTKHELAGDLLKLDNSNVAAVEEERAIRNQLTYPKTFEEAINEDYSREVRSYTPGLHIDTNGDLEYTSKGLNEYKDELGVMPTQIAEFNVLRADGMRYVYGQPAYNLSQEEVIFNAPEHPSNAQVVYNNGDLESGNNNGIDDFVSKEILPAYSYAHLLTKVLSSDYSDLTGDGPTDDDYGSWVKFNYTAQAGPMSDPINPENYNWRFPYFENESSDGIANFNEGLKSRSLDDKANYTYGEKELWFMHSIESKTHIAIFHTSSRADANGVNNALGNTSNVSPKNQKLEQIKYYAKNDLAEFGEVAIPLKTVHFGYENESGNAYTLCQDVPNNFNNTTGNDGKLTLKTLHFTYGNSQKGEFSKYQFNYNESYVDNDNETQDYNYNRRGQDRWGCYKEELTDNYNPLQIANNDPLSNSDFPYAEQNETLANEYAKAWNLSEIILPSGGKININYESDDYAYIQDKRAGQMFTLAGLAGDVPTSFNDLDDNDLLGSTSNVTFNNYLVVKLNENDNSTVDRSTFYNDYLRGIGKLYFRCLVDIKSGKYEFVPGYSSIENYGVFFDPNGIHQGDYGWIKIKGTSFDENTSNGVVNPIAKAAWQFARLYMPELVYPGTDVENSTGQNLVQSLLGIFKTEIPRMIEGFNKRMFKDRYARSIKPEKSWIRLNNPNYNKKGGGCRVSSVTMSDEWSTIKEAGNNDQTSTYGQQYFYKKLVTTLDGEQRVISSGVASYEPMLGNDENPFKQPITTNESRLLAPDNQYYIEKPLGESFYPAASVGYSQVIVADIRPEGTSRRTTTGYSINEFYTAKDFPFHTKVNNVSPYKDKPGIINKLLKFRSKDFVTASKGYSIILNDMHGKPKASWAYGGYLPVSNGDLILDESVLDNENKISGQEFLYRVDNSRIFDRLDNDVDVINPDGSISTSTIGVETEMALDFRQHYTKSTRIEVQGQVDTWIITIPFPPFTIPIPVPSVWGNYSDEATRFRSSVATKVVNQHGLMDKVRVFDQGAILETQNLLYDSQTGEVLLTSVNNEFKDKVTDVDPIVSEEHMLYNMKYPAHWSYTGMQSAFQNIGVEMDVTVDSNGEILVPNADQIYHVGDELNAKGIFFLANSTVENIAYTKLWVSEVNPGNIKVIDRNGNVFNSNFLYHGAFETNDEWHIKITRSGHRNQQSVAIASMTALKNPAEKIMVEDLSGTDTPTAQATALEVLDFGAQEFSDQWEAFCGNEGIQSETVDIDLEICAECTDVIYLIENSADTDDDEFDAMKSITVASISELNAIPNGNFRYAVAEYWDELEDETNISFTNDPFVASDFVRDNNGGGTDVNDVLGDVGAYLSSSPGPTRSECGLTVVLLTQADENEFNLPSSNDNATILKSTGTNLLVFRYRGGNNVSADPLAASIASPGGGNYNGPVNNNNYDSGQSPRRFYPLDLNSQLPNGVATAIHCNKSSLQEEVYASVLCNVTDGDVINPFVNGIRGNWRPSKSYTYKHVPRIQSPVNGSNEVDIANKGYYSEFDQFWNKPVSGGLWTIDATDYINAVEVTKYNPYGEGVESKDAIGIYSSALLGYDKKLAIAVGSNTKYEEMAFDGFEEYTFYIDNNICHPNYHLNLDAVNNVSDEQAHTGYYSYKVGSNTKVTNVLSFRDCPVPGAGPSPTPTPYLISECEDCLPGFNPVYRTEVGAENRYVFDAWIKKDDGVRTINVAVKSTNGNIVNHVFMPTGPVIDGWQRVYEFFELEPNTIQFIITFDNNSAAPMYVDDIRFYPYNANMNSFVYHPSSLKLMAQLDENNHATIYEYDEEWNLIRVKKETERGVMTLQENRSNVRLIRE